MIRLATGDLSAVLPGPSPCGRTNMRIKGWLGRADQTAKVKGMFVHPSQVAEIGKRHRELGRLRLVVGRHDEQDVMTLKGRGRRAGRGSCRAPWRRRCRRCARCAAPSSWWRPAACPTTARSSPMSATRVLRQGAIAGFTRRPGSASMGR
jgi:hypothetical protein